MIPVCCQCANNINSMCMGKAHVDSIRLVCENKIKATECPGYIPIGQEPFKSPHGDLEIGPYD